MAVVKAYLKFKADLRGFAEVKVDEFRARLLPLKARREWSEADAEYVRALAAAGAGRAVQQLCGLGHPAAARVLGPAEIKADPLTRAELEAEMRNLVANCARSGWPRERFLAYGAYLDSAMTPRDLAESAQQTRAAQDLVAGMWARGARAKAAAADGSGDGKEIAPEDVDGLQDHFAEMYRGASLAFRRAVKDCLTLAADRAPAAADPPPGGALPEDLARSAAPIAADALAAREAAPVASASGRRRRQARRPASLVAGPASAGDQARMAPSPHPLSAGVHGLPSGDDGWRAALTRALGDPLGGPLGDQPGGPGLPD